MFFNVYFFGKIIFIVDLILLYFEICNFILIKECLKIKFVVFIGVLYVFRCLIVLLL